MIGSSTTKLFYSTSGLAEIEAAGGQSRHGFTYAQSFTIDCSCPCITLTHSSPFRSLLVTHNDFNRHNAYVSEDIDEMIYECSSQADSLVD
jgi:hypothetical protein